MDRGRFADGRPGPVAASGVVAVTPKCPRCGSPLSRRARPGEGEAPGVTFGVFALSKLPGNGRSRRWGPSRITKPHPDFTGTSACRQGDAGHAGD